MARMPQLKLSSILHIKFGKEMTTLDVYSIKGKCI